MTDYLFALTDAGGTVPPELGVARRLLARGHRVTVLGDASMAEAVAALGARWRAWSEPARLFEDWRPQSPTAMAAGMAETMIAGPAAGHARDTDAALADLEPDAVVTSFVAVGAMIAAEAARLPYAVLMPNIYALPAPGLPPFGLGLAPARGPLGRLRDRGLSAASTRMLARYALGPLNDVRQAHGLPPLTSPWGQHQRASRQLVLTSAAFDFPGTMPESARYVGPVLDDPAWAETSTDWPLPAGDAPLALVALSSTFQNHVEALQRSADALGALGLRGLVTTGPAVDPALIRAPAGIEVVRSAPHQQVFPHVSVVITHGGHGTVMKALAAGVPMVVLPHGRDQADNAMRLTRRGAAVTVPRRATTQQISAAVHRVLRDPGYRQAAERLGEHVRDESAFGALVDELENLPNQR
ncbi:glycosyltransferase [Pseudactinotalea suaedae]|uniref:glycosyltransferase n=1 Tax=Pseudactinotalea suaedae TaxID=1524924 RepID=UPI0012E195D7|nr:glycosyltransferase [Pseudactinotalea suaedae]